MGNEVGFEMSRIRKNTLILLVLLTAAALLSGYSKDTRQVENLFKRMKVKDIKYCAFILSKPGPGPNVYKRLDKLQLSGLVKVLNKSGAASEGRFPLSKGGFCGITIYMNSGLELTLNNINGGFWVGYRQKQYKITLLEYQKIFSTIYKKETAGYNPSAFVIKVYTNLINREMKTIYSKYSKLYKLVNGMDLEKTYKQKLLTLLVEDNNYSYRATQSEVRLYKDTVTRVKNPTAATVAYYRKCFQYLNKQNINLDDFVKKYLNVLEIKRQARVSLFKPETDVNTTTIKLNSKINVQRLSEFINNVNNDVSDSITVVIYTDEGDPISHRMEFAGGVLRVEIDSSQDKFGGTDKNNIQYETFSDKQGIIDYLELWSRFIDKTN